jgi:hypothetical protein
MEIVTGKMCRQIGAAWPTQMLLLGMALVFLASLCHAEEPPKQKAGVPAKLDKVPVYATPIDAYRAYLNAVKRSDLAAAKASWWLPGKDQSALDVIAGMWVASHRLVAAFDKATIDPEQFGRDFVRDDCTDAAIDRTLARLEHSTFTVNGETATLTIRWEKNDGYPNPVFFYGDHPIAFRKFAGGWRIDALAICGLAKPEDFFEKSDWGEMFHGYTMLANEIAAGLESGKSKTATDVVHALEKHVGSLDGRIPLTKTVIYLEDTPTRYLRIKKGNPGICLIAGEQLPHRKDIEYPRRIEGNLQTIFSEMYGVSHPKIVVETKNAKGYEVVYDPKDSKALEIVAKQLGMTVGYDDQEILALQITVAKTGHHLKQVAKPATPQWDCCVTSDDIWPLHGVSMDELALFLEHRVRTPVVDKTGLAGYYWFDLAGRTVRVGPEKTETKSLDETGLQLHWERTKTRVLVVKDK